jgi:hypothetical protein
MYVKVVHRSRHGYWRYRVGFSTGGIPVEFLIQPPPNRNSDYTRIEWQALFMKACSDAMHYWAEVNYHGPIDYFRKIYSSPARARASKKGTPR